MDGSSVCILATCDMQVHASRTHSHAPCIAVDLLHQAGHSHARGSTLKHLLCLCSLTGISFGVLELSGSIAVPQVLGGSPQPPALDSGGTTAGTGGPLLGLPLPLPLGTGSSDDAAGAAAAPGSNGASASVPLGKDPIASTGAGLIKMVGRDALGGGYVPAPPSSAIKGIPADSPLAAAVGATLGLPVAQPSSEKGGKGSEGKGRSSK